jgi:hypothetical protein
MRGRHRSLKIQCCQAELVVILISKIYIFLPHNLYSHFGSECPILDKEESAGEAIIRHFNLSIF